MSIVSGTSSVREVVNEAVGPIPPAVPGEFVVHLGTGWGGSLHDLANGLAVWRDGPEAAVVVLLGCLDFIEVEATGVEECRRLVEGLHRLRGVIMTAGIEAAGVGRGGFL